MAKPDGSVVINTKLNTDGFSDGLQNTKKQFGKLASSAKKIAGTITKVGAAAVTAFGAATVAITKQSISAYADYEQLVGGVETLFKNSADIVVANAENAFYSVGLSANEYMETVTSFSASLISSLGGDTEKAAIAADKALVSMADNANKMGSSLESVQTAFLGFSKQQYMLLDNLKLGYGGTKTEMERLLKDAEAFSGVKYDINNLADVYEAINQIQIKLGVAGTTAKEAEKTITGAANMTKAAWKNVLAAISGGGDLEKAINNFAYSVSKLFQNIVPVVEKSIRGLGTVIERIAPALVESVAAALIRSIPNLLRAVYKMVIGVAKGIYNGIVSLLTGATSEIEKQLNSTEGMSENINQAAEDTEKLKKETEGAANAAKKAVAGFDELNVLSSGSEKTEDIIDFTGDYSETAYLPVEIEIADVVENIPKNVLEKVKEKLQALAEPIEWVWFNVLKPLGDWVIKEAAPKSVGALSSAFEGLASTVGVIFDGIQKLWPYLQPVFQWIGDTVLVVLEDLKKIGDGIAEKWKENAPKIEKIFENIGTVIEKVWVIIGPILTLLRDSLSQIAVDTPINDLQYIIDLLYGLSEIIAGLHTLDIGKIFNGYGTITKAELERAANSMRTYANAVGIDTDTLDQKISGWAESIGEKLSDAWLSVKEIWGDVSAWFDTNVITPVKNAFEPIGQWFSDLWTGIETTFSDVFYNIGVIAGGCWEIIKIAWQEAGNWFDENIIQPISNFFSELWSGISTWAEESWGKIQEKLEPYVTWIDEKIVQPISEFFSGLWDGIKQSASDSAKETEEAFSGIGQFFKNIINKIIEALNSALSWVFGGINDILSGLKEFKIAGKTPFEGIKEINVPQIPYLAKGAVIPPNAPFMAVLGDQRHGTNIEAPLDTIKQALAEVLAMQTNAGGETVVNVKFEGDLAQLARILKPAIETETRRKGDSLATGGVF